MPYVTLIRRFGGMALRRAPFLRGLMLGQFQPDSPISYRGWVRRHDTLSASDRADIAAHVVRLPRRLISLILPPGRADIAEAVVSLRGQLYPHWEICMVGAEAGRSAAGDDPRIRVFPPADADALLDQARGEFIALLPADARLPPHALYEIAAELAAHPDADLLYTDEDRLDQRGRRRAPLFKSGWSADLLLGQDVLGDLAVVRRTALLRAGGIGDPAASHDRALRLSETIAPERIRHIPAVLLHRRAASGPAPADAAAVARHLHRITVSGAEVRHVAHHPVWLCVRRALPVPAPLVSVIVPTRDRAALLARAAAGVLNRTDYPALELIVVDNGSTEPATHTLLAELAQDTRVRVLTLPGPFNYARLNNAAAAEARGEVLLLLNNDVDVIDPSWLHEMVAQAMRPEIGAVGAKLMFADGRLQHGGVALGVSGVAGHVHLLAPRHAPGYAGRLAVARDVAAVTGACLAIRRSVFDAVGGLDAEHLAVAYNDVDLCLRVREAGWRVLWTPFAELYHLESASRPFDLAPEQLARYQTEIAYMHRRWGAALMCDPFYGVNFSLRDGFHSLAAPRRVPPWRASAPVVPLAVARPAAVLAGISSGN